MIYIPQEPQLLNGSALFNIVTHNEKEKINFERLLMALEISEFLNLKIMKIYKRIRIDFN